MLMVCVKFLFYVSLQDLPHNLAEEKTNKEQIEMCFKAYLNENWQTQFD